MSKEMSLFKGGNSLVSGDMFAKLQKLNQNLMSGGGGGGIPRISIRGGRFRQIEGGEQVAVSSDSTMNIVIVNAAPISRTFYGAEYDSDNATPPTCWSRDGRIPAEDVTDEGRQSDTCLSCPKNIKGSGAGESRACKYNQRIAVCLEGDYDKVFQLQLPATSIFGEANGNDMPMGAYAKFLNAHKTPAAAIVTAMSFDIDSEVPKLYFKPVRPLEEDELEKVLEISQSEAAAKAVELTVSQADGVPALGAPAKAEKPAPAPKKEAKVEPVVVDEVEEEEEVVEPVKSSKKKAPKVEPEEDEDLSSILDGWDSED
jgi:hypothetical protein